MVLLGFPGGGVGMVGVLVWVVVAVLSLHRCPKKLPS